jgi:integrase
VVAVLREIEPLRAQPGAFVFTTQAGTPLEAERFVERHWRPALRACGLPPRRLYNTRHTFISLLLTRGANLKWLAEHCGTSVEMIERRYGVFQGDAAAQLALLGGGAARRKAQTRA